MKRRQSVQFGLVEPEADQADSGTLREPFILPSLSRTGRGSPVITSPDLVLAASLAMIRNNLLIDTMSPMALSLFYTCAYYITYMHLVNKLNAQTHYFISLHWKPAEGLA